MSTMTDKMTPKQRHYCMSRIRSKDTGPEMLVRHFLWSNGYRYRLHVKKLNGKPDIVIGRLNVVIFINGCFWHGHGCMTNFPKSNTTFWNEKIIRNQERDRLNEEILRKRGWCVITIWECELTPQHRPITLLRLLNTLKLYEIAGEKYTLPVDDTIFIAAENETPNTID